ncbi:MAG: hypothetical protein RL257_106 [Actinomycetota bacterium]
MTDIEPVASPVKLKVLEVCQVEAVVAFPVNAAVIVPALKLPDVSLETNVDAVLSLVAFDVIVTAAVSLPDPVTDSPVPETATVAT